MPFTDFRMFDHIMSTRADLCEEVLEAILGFDVEIEGKPIAEKSEKAAPEKRGVRFDVRAKGDGKLYDIEMQCATAPDLRKRARFYQGMMDSAALEQGESYNQLPESYVVFICKRDAIESGEAVYRFSMADEEKPQVRLHDGRHVVFVSSCLYNQVEEGELRDLMMYVTDDDHKASTGLVEKITSAVEEANGDDKTMATLMSEKSYVEMMSEALEKSQAETIDLRDRMSNIKKLGVLMNEQGRATEYFEALQDEELMERLLSEFGLAEK